MSCPICGSDAFASYREVRSSVRTVPEGLDRGHFVHVRIERCRICGLFRTIHLSDRRSERELYAEGSVSHNASAAKVKAAGAQCASSTDELEMLSVRPPATLLDVGCGAGQLLLRARFKGYHVEGIDPDLQSVVFVEGALGIPARAGSFELLDKDERFDIISMMGVLEHINDPSRFLRAACAHIRDGGEILVGVPNVESLNRRLSRISRHDWDMFLEPGHLYHYGPATLRKLAWNVGLDMARWSTATIAIRGKIPLLPTRIPTIERWVRSAVQSNDLVDGAYRALLRLFDRAHAGDMLFAVLRPRRSD